MAGLFSSTTRGAGRGSLSAGVVVAVLAYAPGCRPVSATDGATDGATGGATASATAALIAGDGLAALGTLTESERRAIVRLETVDRELRCTATLISPRHALTAAHCLGGGDAYGDAVEAATLDVQGAVGRAPVVSLARHDELDVGVVMLGGPLDVDGAPDGADGEDDDRAIEPLAVSGANLDEMELDSEVAVAGAGSGTPDDAIVSVGRFRVLEVGAETLAVEGIDDDALCVGDSGAPVFAAGGNEVIGVHVTGTSGCFAPWRSVRADRFASWLAERLADAVPFPDAAPCDAAHDEDRCDGDIARLCRSGVWRTVDCGLANYRCDESDGSAVSDASDASDGAGVACVPRPCGDVPAVGRCEDGVARTCLFGTLVEEDCAATGRGCALDPATARRACVECTPCDGACTDLASDPLNCGACDVVCAPDGRGRCIDGACEERAQDGGAGDQGDGGDESDGTDAASGDAAGDETAQRGCAAAADAAQGGGALLALLVARRKRIGLAR